MFLHCLRIALLKTAISTTTDDFSVSTTFLCPPTCHTFDDTLMIQYPGVTRAVHVASPFRAEVFKKLDIVRGRTVWKAHVALWEASGNTWEVRMRFS